MKPISDELSVYLAAARNSTKPLLMAECFTFTLAGGATLNVTNTDLPVTCDGAVYLADTLTIDGLKYKADRSLSVDTQQITLTAGSNDSFSGIGSGWSDGWSDGWGSGSSFVSTPILIALAGGLFDGAQIVRKRAFLANWALGPGGSASAIGAVTMFAGRVATIDEIGRVSAKITVNSDLAFLDIDMPKFLFASNCVWPLYGAGCGASRAAFTTSAAAEVGSTLFSIAWSGALASHRQGTLVWLTGANAGLSVTIGSVQAGVSLSPIVGLPSAPAAGDQFTVSFGCDHTRLTCRSVFNNIANYRGYDFVPPPVMSI